MHTVEKYLISQQFNKVENIELLKISFSSENTDLRYFWEDDTLGLHINKIDFTHEDWRNLCEQGISRCLKVLYLSSNSIEVLTFRAYEFLNLTFINLSLSEKLSGLTLVNFENLIECNVNHCGNLKVIKLLGKFPNLKKLDVSYCILKSLILPNVLPSLSYLNFTRNRIKSISFLKFIANEQKIDLDNLFCDENPLPESFINTLNRKEIDVLIAYLGDYTKKLVNVRRKKLILLGNTQAGKTSLCDILLDSNYATGLSTHGINIFTYEPVEDVSIQVFDFGGQDFYHNSHISFYSINANYLLIFGNGQKDEYGNIQANNLERTDDIFPKRYWLNSVNANLRISTLDTNEDINKLYRQKNIKLALLENLKGKAKPQRLNQKLLEEEFVVSEFWNYSLRQINGAKIKNSITFKKVIDDWLLTDIRNDQLREDIKTWGEIIQNENQETAVLDKDKLLKSNIGTVSELELKILHDSYYIFLCEAKNEEVFPEVLGKKVIVNLPLFSQWIYTILNLENLLGKGYFSKENAKEWLEKKKYMNAVEHLDFIIAFLLYEKMIFKIESSEKYLVPQYLIEPQYPADKLLLRLFKVPFVKYQFTGFYHTQLLTQIISEFFERIAKERVDNQYKYLIWKNKVILYLEKHTDMGHSNPSNFLLIEFAIIEQQPTLSLSVLNNRDLSQRYEAIKKVIDFIDKSLNDNFIKHLKLIKAPNNHYINSLLLFDSTTDSRGNTSDLIFDSKTKCFFRKGDFPLFVDPDKYPMKKIFISYSKSDVKYRDEFKKHFYPLKRQSLIDTFDDSDLGFGEWNSAILKKIEECDIFVCLVSIDFLNTGYIIDTELPHAIKHNKEIVPIKIRDCDWSDFIVDGKDNDSVRLGQFNVALKAKAITLFVDKVIDGDARQNTTEERDAIWTKVVEQFKRIYFRV
ncbi:TIR domain-containing protein [Flectobacillus roseus]|uniref:TIR domain-containing protein n=1 Tax=Flectobacillus roseus TaxID=502259 RepID=UPI0024B67DA8|nr:TIR domain-containing protein [Flectobacillus roseus]MDI9870725.1 ADP-ribosylation factor-like protein [Flectobacillus roseus]